MTINTVVVDRILQINISMYIYIYTYTEVGGAPLHFCVAGAAATLFLSGALEVFGALALPLFYESNNKVMK